MLLVVSIKLAWHQHHMNNKSIVDIMTTSSCWMKFSSWLSMLWFNLSLFEIWTGSVVQRQMNTRLGRIPCSGCITENLTVLLFIGANGRWQYLQQLQAPSIDGHQEHWSVHNDGSHQDHQHHQRISLENSWTCECNSAFLGSHFAYMVSKNRCYFCVFWCTAVGTTPQAVFCIWNTF